MLEVLSDIKEGSKTKILEIYNKGIILLKLKIKQLIIILTKELQDSELTDLINCLMMNENHVESLKLLKNKITDTGFC